MITVIDRDGTAVVKSNFDSGGFDIITESEDMEEIIAINLFELENSETYTADVLSDLATRLKTIYTTVHFEEEPIDEDFIY